MLTHLHIKNYALIANLDVDFSSGLTVLTGETGAGKSIILGALALVMGARADAKTITDGEERCIIEASFLTDDGNDILIRRELHANGRSRSFVNDEVVSLAELKALSAQLIDIHSQHANLLLENDDFQREVIDALADNQSQREQYGACYTAYREAERALRDAEERIRKAKEEADYIAFRYQTLADAHLEQGEMQALEEEQYRLAHAEEIRLALDTAVAILTGDEASVEQLLRRCDLRHAAPELQERIHSAAIELQDIASDASRMSEKTEIDPQRLEQVEERISLLQDLLRKYHAENENELLLMRDQLAEQMQQLATADESITRLRQQVTETLAALQHAAMALRQTRQAVGPQVRTQLEKDLLQLGIAHAHVDVEITDLDDYTETGKDNIQFLFAANLNQSLRRVSEVASGGEMSRLMLCIKALVAEKAGLPTILFDEIDTGVSGDIAGKMGAIMRRMSGVRQIIAITHLPQIAAQGEHHLLVYKQDTDARTETHIRALSADERIEEIATMLSGKHPTEVARENAKQLLLCSH